MGKIHLLVAVAAGALVLGLNSARAADIEPGEDYGPLKTPPAPQSEEHPLFHFAQLTGGYPMAFTNPFVLDLDGNGRFDAPRVQEAP